MQFQSFLLFLGIFFCMHPRYRETFLIVHRLHYSHPHVCQTTRCKPFLCEPFSVLWCAPAACRMPKCWACQNWIAVWNLISRCDVIANRDCLPDVLGTPVWLAVSMVLDLPLRQKGLILCFFFPAPNFWHVAGAVSYPALRWGEASLPSTKRQRSDGQRWLFSWAEVWAGHDDGFAFRSTNWAARTYLQRAWWFRWCRAPQTMLPALARHFGRWT